MQIIQIIMERAMGKAFVVGVLLIVMAAGRDAWAALPRSATPTPPKPAYEVGVSIYFDAWVERKADTCRHSGQSADCELARLRDLATEKDLIRARLDHLVALHANTIILTVPISIDRWAATTVYKDPLLTPSDEQIAYFIREARSRGLFVTIKPLIDETVIRQTTPAGRPNWRGGIEPADPARFFANYAAVYTDYAQLAALAGADRLVIGTELSSLEAPRYEGHWRDVIATIRAAVGSKVSLIYGQNWNPPYPFPSWFAQLDELGIDAYYPLLGVSDQGTAADLVNAFNQTVVPEMKTTPRQQVERLKTQFPGKKLRILEMGLPSTAGRYAAPWKTEDGVVNLAIQATYTDAACQFYGPDLTDGIFWWAYGLWDLSDPLHDGSHDISGKPAEQALARCFASR
jgi:hypothetical protein